MYFGGLCARAGCVCVCCDSVVGCRYKTLDIDTHTRAQCDDDDDFDDDDVNDEAETGGEVFMLLFSLRPWRVSRALRALAVSMCLS